MNIICVARFRAFKGMEEKLISSLRELITPTRQEAGCQQYNLYIERPYKGSSGEPWHVCLIEKWRSMNDFELHCDTTYIRNFFENTALKYVDKSDVRLYNNRD